jgi:5-methylcytosine-specific restriction endonuclease McrA
MKNGKRDYKAELNWENTKATHRLKDREERHKARDLMEKQGKVRKGDGKHVDHKKPLSKGGSNTVSNLRVTSASSNSSFSRNKDGSLKSQTSKREGKRK